MKLYATTTSERASKGQGGNDGLVVEFSVGSKAREFFASILLKPNYEKGVYEMKLRDRADQETPIYSMRIKDEDKQKGKSQKKEY